MSDSRGNNSNVLLWVFGAIGCMVVGSIVAGVLLVIMGAGASFFTLRQAEVANVEQEAREAEASARQAEEALRSEAAASEARAAAEAAEREREMRLEQERLELERSRAGGNAPTDPDDPLGGLEGL